MMTKKTLGNSCKPVGNYWRIRHAALWEEARAISLYFWMDINGAEVAQSCAPQEYN